MLNQFKKSVLLVSVGMILGAGVMAVSGVSAAANNTVCANKKTAAMRMASSCSSSESDVTSSLKGATGDKGATGATGAAGAAGPAMGGATANASAFPNAFVSYASTTSTFTVAQLLTNRIIVTSQTAPITITMPTAAATLTAIDGEKATTTFEFTIVNNGTGLVTLAPGAGFTSVGNMTVTASSATTDGSGSWMCVVTVKDVSAICYRK
ncbi:MAG: hypothetical protein NT119_06650 [Actinobacteria bacterium]|nr:hypothetical protein [Actinomycetota bacterium]